MKYNPDEWPPRDDRWLDRRPLTAVECGVLWLMVGAILLFYYVLVHWVL